MKSGPRSIKATHMVIAGLAIAVAVLALLLWNESRTERVEFSIGGRTLEVEAEG